MRERKKEIEIHASIDQVFSLLMKYPHFNVNKAEKTVFKDANTWLEISNGEIIRRMEMKVDAHAHCIFLLVYNSNTLSHFDEKITISVKEKERNVCTVIISCNAGETFSSKIGFHARRFSVDVWMEKVLDIIKNKVYSM